MEDLERLLQEAQVAQTDERKLTLKIREKLIQLFRSITHYGRHLDGFIGNPPEIPRVTYLEDHSSSELTDAELKIDDRRRDEEIEVLGSIGFKNAKVAYLKFPEAIVQIGKQTRELCQKLYQGENAHYLEGPEKIPGYLSTFLQKMDRQAADFRISQVRRLRSSAQRFQDLLPQVPSFIFKYLQTVNTTEVESKIRAHEVEYDR